MTVTIEEPPTSRLPGEVFPLLATLRPGLTRAAFDQLITEGGAQGLTVLAAVGESGQYVGAALYRVMTTSRGKLLFVDDLVTDTASRSGGVGAELLHELERRGRVAGCDRVELDSGMTNQAAHRFYYRHRMGAIALHFAKELEQ